MLHLTELHNGLLVLIPVDNIAYVTTTDDITRIYLRQIAASGETFSWYVMVRETVEQIAAAYREATRT